MINGDINIDLLNIDPVHKITIINFSKKKKQLSITLMIMALPITVSFTQKFDIEIHFERGDLVGCIESQKKTV